MELINAVVAVADAIGIILSALLLAVRWNRQWADEQAKWLFVMIFIWAVVLGTEYLILR